MMRAAIPALLLPLALAGCGNQESATPAGSAGSASSSPDTVGSCRAGSEAVRRSTTVGRADLDGDGTQERLRLTPAGSDCPNVVFAEAGGRILAAQVPTDGPPVRKAFGLSVPDVRGDLLATRQEHPRGGYQLRIFAPDGGRLSELRVGDHALLPFVATDVQEHPVNVACVPGGLEVTEAVAHEPAGAAMAWDVQQTTYRIDGDRVRRGKTEKLADNVLPQQLEKQYPALVDDELLEGCGG